MAIMPGAQWDEVREDLVSSDTEKLRQAVVHIGKIKTETIPDDIAHAVILLLSHSEARVRVEAVRAIGLHWRLASAAKAIGDLVSTDDDWHVRLSAINALGAIGREDSNVRCLISRVLAKAVLSERFDDDERMLATITLLFVEGKIGKSEYVEADRDLPKSFAEFEIDRPWIEGLAKGSCEQ
jgi:HEAT repeat protein